MDYRKANVYDAGVLAELRLAMLCENANYSDKYKAYILDNTKQYITDEMKDGSFVCWVAIHDNSIIAMGGVTFFCLPPNDWCPTGKTAYIGNMYTIPVFRRQGVAHHLIELIFGEAKERGCERILLNATDIGRHLYEKFGFETWESAMALYPFGIIPEM
jgi:GNAT superfamily N-acetyltransferase